MLKKVKKFTFQVHFHVRAPWAEMTLKPMVVVVVVVMVVVVVVVVVGGFLHEVHLTAPHAPHCTSVLSS